MLYTLLDLSLWPANIGIPISLPRSPPSISSPISIGIDLVHATIIFPVPFTDIVPQGGVLKAPERARIKVYGRAWFAFFLHVYSRARLLDGPFRPFAVEEPFLLRPFMPPQLIRDKTHFGCQSVRLFVVTYKYL